MALFGCILSCMSLFHESHSSPNKSKFKLIHRFSGIYFSIRNYPMMKFMIFFLFRITFEDVRQHNYLMQFQWILCHTSERHIYQILIYKEES